jgi:hypothetical protein
MAIQGPQGSGQNPAYRPSGEITPRTGRSGFSKDSGTLEELLIRCPGRQERFVAHHIKVTLQPFESIQVDFFCHAAKWQKSKIFHGVTGYSH